jgi:hypothetical protein
MPEGKKDTGFPEIYSLAYFQRRLCCWWLDDDDGAMGSNRNEPDGATGAAVTVAVLENPDDAAEDDDDEKSGKGSAGGGWLTLHAQLGTPSVPTSGLLLRSLAASYINEGQFSMLIYDKFNNNGSKCIALFF